MSLVCGGYCKVACMLVGRISLCMFGTMAATEFSMTWHQKSHTKQVEGYRRPMR